MNKDNDPLREEAGWVFHLGLQTHVYCIEYNWHERYGQIWARGPVDMSGAIRLFMGIDKGVELICAYLDGKPDVAYRRRNGLWEVGQLRHERSAIA